ncbi:phosphatase PAP2 family protein [Candidatus Poribacteria bacterium]|nr:phosphatase PAP2 family protein [Candidatus Poribacteria bacterium]
MWKNLIQKAKVCNSDVMWTWFPPATALVISFFVYFCKINGQLFLTINGLQNVTGTTIWSNITILGDGMLATILIILLIRRRPDVVWTIAVASILSVIILRTGKMIFNTPRPPMIFEEGSFFLSGPCYRRNGFPSGHATTAFTIGGSLVMMYRNTIFRYAIFVIAGIIAISRVMVGIHWPIDILAGMIIGWVSSWLALVIVKQKGWQVGPWKQKIVGLILLTASIVSITGYDTGYPRAFWFHRIISIIVILAGSYELAHVYSPTYALRGLSITKRTFLLLKKAINPELP